MTLLRRIVVSTATIASLLSVALCPSVAKKISHHTIKQSAEGHITNPKKRWAMLPYSAGEINVARNSTFYRQNHMDLALTIWAEARGEGELGMRLVGEIIVNRLNTGKWGTTIGEVVRSPHQFAPWHTNVKAKMMGIKYEVERGNISDDFEPAMEIADKLILQRLLGDYKDSTHGALFFYTLYDHIPTILRKAKSFIVGNHRFIQAEVY